ncbi:MAG: MBL fold metallo-hydrolase [Verrucomicrobia bacterium]|nr:MBL fold metallo-hydrolase [Verrucomicrobiota bacterium]
MNRLIISAVFVLFSIAFSIGADTSSGALEIKVFHVGQADAILVTCPDKAHHLLIDAADTRYPKSSEQFKSNLLKEFEGHRKELAVVVASHPHEDHIGNMKWVLQNFQVKTYVDNGQKVDSAHFGQLNALRRTLVNAGNMTYINGKQSSFSKIDFCPAVQVEIIEPWAKRELTGSNDRSVAVRMDYKHKSFLFLGDLEQRSETVMLNNFSDVERQTLDADVVKVGHHGSDTSSTVQFINAVGPDIAIISCGQPGVGTNARYKHPRLSTVRHYRDWFKNHTPSAHSGTNLVWAYNAENKKWQQEARPDGVWLTSEDGTITIRWDGQTLQVDKERQ